MCEKRVRPFSPMIPYTEAFDIIDRETTPLGTSSVALGDAVGRILAEDIVADTDLPPFDRSQMDGYAVKASDTLTAPVELRIVGESAAGRGWPGELKIGEAVRIMTGARLPAGADAVQRLELSAESPALLQRAAEQDETVETSSIVRILEPTEANRFIVAKGAEIVAGTKVFSKGEPVTAGMVAGMAAFGYSNVAVGLRPRVAVLSTGSEIVRIDQKPAADQIRNSNAPMIAAFLAECGGKAEELAIVRDNVEQLTESIAKAAGNSDVLIITGGVSVGKYDLTKDVLRSLGAEIYFEKVRLKPGKPTVFGRLGRTLIFGLPGNPVSAAVTFQLFARRAVLGMQGAADTSLRSGFAVAAKRGKGTAERDTFLPAAIDTNDAGRTIATPLKWLGSSDFIGFAKAEALIFIPAGSHVAEGDVVRTFKI